MADISLKLIVPFMNNLYQHKQFRLLFTQLMNNQKSQINSVHVQD